MFNLIPYLNVIDNIILPCTFSPIRNQRALSQSHSLINAAHDICAQLDIDEDLINRPVHQLSIGQQQRVAIARAFIGNPEIIVADEPTSALDNTRKNQFMNTLINTCNKHNTTLIFVSHDTSLKTHFEHVHQLSDLSHQMEPNNELI